MINGLNRCVFVAVTELNCLPCILIGMLFSLKFYVLVIPEEKEFKKIKEGPEHVSAVK